LHHLLQVDLVGFAVGRTTFVELLREFLVAFGALDSEKILRPQLHEFRRSNEGGATKLFEKANPGILFVKDAGKFLHEGKENSTEFLRAKGDVGRWHFGSVPICLP
jgi:hypothetical protein